MAVDNSVLNSLSNRLASINIKTNTVIDSDSNNSSSDKESYLFDNCSFLSNNDYHKNNLDIASNNKSSTSLIVSIKKRKWQ